MVVEDPRTRRLRSDYEKLVELKSRSDLIDFEVFNELPGMPPEQYVITYTCRGIASIDRRRQPVYSEEHKVAIYLDATYPTTPPRMKWLTPIWHPNIQHEEPFGVCIDNTWWSPGRTLDKVVLMMGEMVQYKNYHPYHTAPYPVDTEVAEWALWAESEGLIGPGRPVDYQELLRPQRVRVGARGAKGRVKITDGGSASSESSPPGRRRVKVLDAGTEGTATTESRPRSGRIRVVE